MRLYSTAASFSSVLLIASSLFAQDKAPAQGPMGGGFSLILMMVFMFLIIYFLMIRPEQKKQKERQSMINASKKGDKVVTVGGLMGTIHSVKENTVMVRIAENTIVELTKAAIASVMTEGAEKSAEKAPAEVKEIKEKKK